MLGRSDNLCKSQAAGSIGVWPSVILTANSKFCKAEHTSGFLPRRAWRLFTSALLSIDRLRASILTAAPQSMHIKTSGSEVQYN